MFIMKDMTQKEKDLRVKEKNRTLKDDSKEQNHSTLNFQYMHSFFLMISVSALVRL